MTHEENYVPVAAQTCKGYIYRALEKKFLCMHIAKDVSETLSHFAKSASSRGRTRPKRHLHPLCTAWTLEFTNMDFSSPLPETKKRNRIFLGDNGYIFEVDKSDGHAGSSNYECCHCVP